MKNLCDVIHAGLDERANVRCEGAHKHKKRAPQGLSLHSSLHVSTANEHRLNFIKAQQRSRSILTPAQVSFNPDTSAWRRCKSSADQTCQSLRHVRTNTGSVASETCYYYYYRYYYCYCCCCLSIRTIINMLDNLFLSIDWHLFWKKEIVKRNYVCCRQENQK